MDAAKRLATATAHGANYAMLEVADVIVGMHAVEVRQAESSLWAGEGNLHNQRARVLCELAREIEKLCVTLKLEAPPALRKVK